MNILLLLICLILQGNTLTILNKEDKTPVANAFVTGFHKGRPVETGLTSQYGIFENYSRFDSVTVSHPGFEKLTVYDTNTAAVAYLSPAYIKLNDVIVKSKNTEILGRPDAKSKETLFLLPKEHLALRLKPKDGNKYIIDKIRLNVKEVKYSADVIVKLYAPDTLTRTYTRYKKKVQVSSSDLLEIVPDAHQLLLTLQYRLEKGSTGLVDIDIVDKEFHIPAEGIFVSIYSGALYSDDDNILTNQNYKKYPEIFLHKTKEFNYAKIFPDRDGDRWQNNNLLQKNDYETDGIPTLLPPTFYEPSIGISVIKSE